MDNCMNCKHSVFDEFWGEYKCKALCRKIYILLDSSECKMYEKKDKKESK